MKRAIYLNVLLLATTILSSCDTENTLTCIKTTGEIITTDYEVASFDSIIVFERVQLIVKDAPIVSVQLETGENLLEDFEVFVMDNTLQIKNNGACNLVRDYDDSKFL